LRQPAFGKAWNIAGGQRFFGLALQERPMSETQTPEFEQTGDRVAQAYRDIQTPLDAKEERSFEPQNGEPKENPKKSHAMQAGARPYPGSADPEQHQAKPGFEAALDPGPDV
jgi:hypothetical protein